MFRESENKENASLEAILDSYQKLFQKNPNKLRKAIPANEIWRFFVDGCEQKSRDWRGYEKKEQGYLLAMTRGFNLIFGAKQKLNKKFIKNLHMTTTQGVKNLNYELKVCKNLKGNFRHSLDTTASFPLTTDTMTKEGLHELFVKLSQQNEQDPVFLTIDVSNYSDPDNYEKIVEEIVKSKFEKVLELHEEKVKFAVKSALIKEDGFEKYIQQLIVEYQDKVNSATNDLEKLTAIITFIRDCEQSHAFDDGNCRTFCMLLLNYLLIQNGFPLAILRDPNCFDGYAINQLVQEVIQGMRNTLDLIKNQCLYNVTTAETLKNATEEEQACFSTITKIEKQNRGEISAVSGLKKYSFIGACVATAAVVIAQKCMSL